MAMLAIPLQQRHQIDHDPEGTLYSPDPDAGQVEGGPGDFSRSFSLYSWLESHPAAAPMSSPNASTWRHVRAPVDLA